MPRIIITKEDAENAFKVLKEHKDTLGFVPKDVIEVVRDSVKYGREGAKLHFYKLLGEDKELLKAFHEKPRD